MTMVKSTLVPGKEERSESMLRLAHQILSRKPIIPKTIYPQARANFLRQYQLAQMIASPACHTIIADNVATTYADTPKQDWTLNGKNFACIAPPFQTGWFIEWVEPNHPIGPNGREEVPEDERTQSAVCGQRALRYGENIHHENRRQDRGNQNDSLSLEVVPVG